MKTIYMDTSDSCDNPIDLSRRCDSVETRKTPSPSDNSSLFVESPPSFGENSSPSLSAIDARKKSVIMRSDTPPNGYQPKYTKRAYSLPENPQFPPASIKHEKSPSPPLRNVPHEHYKQETRQHLQLSSSPQINTNDHAIESFAMHSAALHQKLQHVSVKTPPSTPSSPESAKGAQYPLVRGRDGKVTRPFKAYKHDKLCDSFASIPSAAHPLTDPCSDERYLAFHQQMIKQIYAANGGQPTITNPKMRRTNAQSSVDRYIENESQSKQQQQNKADFETQLLAQQQNGTNFTSDSSEASFATNSKGPIKDSAYYERRRKNNAAAKKSRDRRRMKEDNIVIRCAYLERENMALRTELETIKKNFGLFVTP